MVLQLQGSTPGKRDEYHNPKHQPSSILALSVGRGGQMCPCTLFPIRNVGREGAETVSAYSPLLTQPVPFFFFFLYSSITLGCSYLFSYRSILSLLAFVSIKTWQTLFTLKDKTEISGSCLSPGRMQPSAAGSGPKCWFALVVPSCFLCGCHQCWGRDSLKRQ